MENANETYEEIDEIDDDFIDDYEELDSDNNNYEDDSEIEKSENEEDEEEDEEDEEDEIDSKEDPIVNFVETTKSSSSILRNRLTKYEFTRLFSIRVTQIQKGAMPMVSVEQNMSVEDIVKKEFSQGKVPLLIERSFPKEKTQLKEYCKINQLINVSII
jgi:DNA-directed RNA polymerase subunit K/omega